MNSGPLEVAAQLRGHLLRVESNLQVRASQPAIEFDDLFVGRNQSLAIRQSLRENKYRRNNRFTVGVAPEFYTLRRYLLTALLQLQEGIGLEEFFIFMDKGIHVCALDQYRILRLRLFCAGPRFRGGLRRGGHRP